MSTYYTTYPESLSFPKLSAALQASVYWQPTLTLTIVINTITSAEIESLRVKHTASEELFLESYEEFVKEMKNSLVGFSSTNLEELTLLENILENYLGIDFWVGLKQLGPLQESYGGVLRAQSVNYFDGIAYAIGEIYKVRPRLGMPNRRQRYCRKLIDELSVAWQNKNNDRGDLADEIKQQQETIQQSVGVVFLDLIQDTLEVDSAVEWTITTNSWPTGAKVEAIIHSPVLADEQAELINTQLTTWGDIWMESLQNDFPNLIIPLQIPSTGYNPEGLTEVSNLRFVRNGTATRYPVEDALTRHHNRNQLDDPQASLEATGSYLWVDGNESNTGFTRYGGNSGAVNPMKNFIARVFDTQLVSEHEQEYSVAGADLSEYITEYELLENRLASGEINDEDYENAIQSLQEVWGYYGQISTAEIHMLMIEGGGGGLINPPLEEVFEGVLDYDDFIEGCKFCDGGYYISYAQGDAVDALEVVCEECEGSGKDPHPPETFNTQISELEVMESEQSRPFFDPAQVEPYDLREHPSGSEVSFGAEEDEYDGHKHNWEWRGHGTHPTRFSKEWICDICNASIDSIKKPSETRKVNPDTFHYNWVGPKQSIHHGAESFKEFWEIETNCPSCGKFSKRKEGMRCAECKRYCCSKKCVGYGGEDVGMIFCIPCSKNPELWDDDYDAEFGAEGDLDFTCASCNRDVYEGQYHDSRNCVNCGADYCEGRHRHEIHSEDVCEANCMICPSCYWSDNCKGVINEEEFQAESFGAECTGVESGGYHEWGSYPAEVHQVSYDGQDGRFSALVNVTLTCLYCNESFELCMVAEDDVGIMGAETFNTEWGNHELDEEGYCEICDAYGLNCIEQGGNSPQAIKAVEETIQNLERSIRAMREAGVQRNEDLERTLKQTKLKLYSLLNENRCTCDKEYGEADPDCLACLNEWRNQRYGPDVHDVECVCNDCVPIGGFGSYYAETFEADGCNHRWEVDDESMEPFFRRGNLWVLARCRVICAECGRLWHTSKEWSVINRRFMAETFDADETVVARDEVKGITTETRQYQDTSYDVPTMRKEIDKDIRNKVDDDDEKYVWKGRLQAVGVGVGALVLASLFNSFKNRK